MKYSLSSLLTELTILANKAVDIKSLWKIQNKEISFPALCYGSLIIEFFLFGIWAIYPAERMDGQTAQNRRVTKAAIICGTTDSKPGFEKYAGETVEPNDN